MPQTGSAPVNKHAQIAASIHAQIKRGDYCDRLPNRMGLAHLFNVNLKTIDKALATLRKERVVLPCHGLGLFVHPRLKNHVVSECFLVFPGHRALTDITNSSRYYVAQVLEQLLDAAHDYHAELKFLPISPLNNNEINWTLLQHLKKGDYALFPGIQYWDVIQKLAKRGCRCLILSDTPNNYGFTTGRMPLLSVDIDYLGMMQILTDYFVRHQCRHPAVIIDNWENRSFWPLKLEKLATLCRQQGMTFSLLGNYDRPVSNSDIAEYCGKLRSETPPVDAFFSLREMDACRIRNFINHHFPATSSKIRVIGYDNDCTWRGDHYGVDVLCKPLAEMTRHLLQVACDTLPFEAGFKPYSAVLKQAEDPGPQNPRKARKEAHK